MSYEQFFNIENPNLKNIKNQRRSLQHNHKNTKEF